MAKLSGNKVILSLVLWLMLIGFIALMPWLPFSLDKKINVSFLDNIAPNKAIVFFGFPACDNICPTTLMVLADLLDANKNIAADTQVIFIDIDSNSNGEAADSFAKLFHISFLGFHPTTDELNILKAEFGLNVKQKADQIRHQGRTYQLQKTEQQWWLTKVYNPNTFSVETLAENLY